MRAVLDFLNISKVNVLGHHKGVGLAGSLALEHPELINRIIFAEYIFPGFGYETCVTSPEVYRIWQLAFFTIPDAAQFFIQGREREMLCWYFYHGSYSGSSVISGDILEAYTRAISKPGFLRAGMQYFAAAFSEAQYLQERITSTGKLHMPVLALRGEAQFSPLPAVRAGFGQLPENLAMDVVPKAGYWIGDENPDWVARRALDFFGNGSDLFPVDITWLDDGRTTMFGNLGLSDMLTPGVSHSGPAL